MNGVNKVIILGFVSKDFETKTSTTGSKFAYASVGTQKTWSDKTTGKLKNKVTWIDVMFTGDYAENAPKLLKKGSQVYLEGEIQVRQVDSINKMEIVISRVSGGSFQVLQKGKDIDVKNKTADEEPEPVIPKHASESVPFVGDAQFVNEIYDNDEPPF